jgi:hypothetical protein
VKRNTPAFIVTYLTLLVVLVAADGFDTADVHESLPLGSKTANFIEYVIKRLDVYPPNTNSSDLRIFGLLSWTGYIVNHGQETVRVSDRDLNRDAFACLVLSDMSGRVWRIVAPKPYSKRLTLVEKYNIELKGNESRVLHGHQTLGELVLRSGANQGTSGNTNQYPSELRYSLDLKCGSCNEQGDWRGKNSITFSGAGSFKVNKIKE